MKKVLLLVLMAYSWLPMQSESVDYEVKLNGVYYRLNASWKGSIALEARGRGVGDITVPSNATRRAYVISGTKKYTGNVTIPASVEYEGNTYPVKSISDGAFKDCITLNSVSMTNSIESIGKEAFAGCTFLKDVRLPQVIYDFGRKAFAGCTNLESVSLSESSSDARAFLSSSANTRGFNLIFYSKVMGDSVFVNCTKLKKVALPGGIERIGNRIFENCESLTSVSFNVGNTFASVFIGAAWLYVGTGLFIGCKNIKDVYVDRPYYINKGYRGISDDTFDETVYNNATLHYVQGSEESFRKSRGWKNFVNIVSMDNTTTISFSYSKVKDICVANWDTDGDGELSESEAASVTNLGGVFQGNKEITSFDELQYFTGITQIGAQEFEECNNLASITIPSGVTSIGDYAFAGCSNLASITTYITSPFEINDASFDTQTYETANLIVPHGTKSTYQKVNGWKNFKNIVETGSEPVTVKTVDVAEAGTLANYISDSEKYTLTELTVTGYLNSTDFKLLRDMAGNNYLGEETAGKLLKLDLDGATIVKGGEN